jgi:hypothetical protein
MMLPAELPASQIHEAKLVTVVMCCLKLGVLCVQHSHGATKCGDWLGEDPQRWQQPDKQKSKQQEYLQEISREDCSPRSTTQALKLSMMLEMVPPCLSPSHSFSSPTTHTLVASVVDLDFVEYQKISCDVLERKASSKFTPRFFLPLILL